MSITIKNQGDSMNKELAERSTESKIRQIEGIACYEYNEKIKNMQVYYFKMGVWTGATVIAIIYITLDIIF